MTHPAILELCEILSETDWHAGTIEEVVAALERAQVITRSTPHPEFHTETWVPGPAAPNPVDPNGLRCQSCDEIIDDEGDAHWVGVVGDVGAIPLHPDCCGECDDQLVFDRHCSAALT